MYYGDNRKKIIVAILISVVVIIGVGLAIKFTGKNQVEDDSESSYTEVNTSELDDYLNIEPEDIEESEELKTVDFETLDIDVIFTGKWADVTIKNLVKTDEYPYDTRMKSLPMTTILELGSALRYADIYELTDSEVEEKLKDKELYVQIDLLNEAEENIGHMDITEDKTTVLTIKRYDGTEVKLTANGDAYNSWINSTVDYVFNAMRADERMNVLNGN